MARLFDDGSSEYLEIDSAVVSNWPLTISAWVYSDSATADQAVLMVGNKGSSVKMHFLYLAGTQPSAPVRMASITAGTPAFASTSSGYSANTWHHVAGSVTAADARSAWIDGGSKGTNSDSEDPGAVADRTSIGRLGDLTPGFYFSGRIAEIAAWNVGLTDTDVANLALRHSPLSIVPESLVAYWQLIESNGDIDYLNDFNLTAFNTPSWAAHPSGIMYPVRRPAIFQIPAIF